MIIIVIYLNVEFKSHEHDPGVIVLLDQVPVLRPVAKSLLTLEVFHEIPQMLKKYSLVKYIFIYFTCKRDLAQAILPEESGKALGIGGRLT